MNRILSQFVLFALFFCNLAYHCSGQEQPNIGFETGTTDYWKFDTGRCCPIGLGPITYPIADRHTITTGTDLDPFGHFPIVSPYGGKYSMRLGNSNVGGEAEGATYFVHVPTGTTNYSIIYHYAIVLNDGGHEPEEQPRFLVNVYDSSTNTPITCAQFLYVASSNLPGFKTSDSQYSVYYRPWTTGSIDLSGYEGKTVSIVFSTGDCSQGGHFGYAYIDVSTGLFAINTLCYNSNYLKLKGPDGYANYKWYDSATFILLDTSQYFKVNNDSIKQVFALVLEPYPGFGCPDTLYTRVKPSSHIGVIPKSTEVCKGTPITLTANVTGNNNNISYSWMPASVVNCNTCQTVVFSLTDSSSLLLVLKADDNAGCVIVDSLWYTQEDCSELFIPNAFTPNDDGNNDIFRVLGMNIDKIQEFSLSVYNRFGERVFCTGDSRKGWNGKYNNIDQEVGTYFYMLKYKIGGKQELLSGDVTLVR